MNLQVTYYNEHLKNNGHKEKEKYQHEIEDKHIKKWKRNIIWFNLPFSRSVIFPTSIAQTLSGKP